MAILIPCLSKTTGAAARMTLGSSSGLRLAILDPPHVLGWPQLRQYMPGLAVAAAVAMDPMLLFRARRSMAMAAAAS